MSRSSDIIDSLHTIRFRYTSDRWAGLCLLSLSISLSVDRGICGYRATEKAREKRNSTITEESGDIRYIDIHQFTNACIPACTRIGGQMDGVLDTQMDEQMDGERGNGGKMDVWMKILTD